MPYTPVNTIQLHYETYGSSDKPELLFIHGLGSSTCDWELQVPYFENDYYVIVVDVRGHGKSDKPKSPYSIALFAADIASLLDALKIDKVHLAGISMGGMIAFQMAVDFPERLHSVTIINATASLVPKTPNERISIWSRFFVVRLLGMRKMGEVLAKRLFIYPEQADLRQTFIERWAENDTRAYLNAMRALVGWSVEAQVSKITIPTLLIASDADYSPLALKEAIVARMPHAQLTVIEDARHAVTAERPEPFNAALAGFLKNSHSL
jgi:pimeloyl-ACP methyl ester carboxylesterase